MNKASVRIAARAAALVALAIALSLPVSAFAATFTNQYPVGTVNAVPQLVGVTAFSPVAFDTRGAQIKIDGVAYTTLVRSGSVSGYWSATEVWNATLNAWTIKWTWVPTVSDPNKVTLYSYPVFATPLSDGVHTVTATLKDKTGAAFTDTWTFVYGTAPALGAPAPADRSTVATTSPVITLPFSDNGPGACSATATVNSVDAAAVISGGVVRVTSPLLPNDATATVTVTVTDSAGFKSSKSWSFFVQIYPEMTPTITQCASCHPGYETHPDMHEDCLDCHDGMVDKPHQGTPASYHAKADVSLCRPCHVSDLSVEHARYVGTSGTALTCVTCHGSSDPAVVAAIATHQTSCVACHAGVDHTASHAQTTASFCAKSGCHVAVNLIDEHITAPIKPTSQGTCDTCHSSMALPVVTAIATGDKNCMTCHGQMLSGHDAMHESVMDPECLHCHEGSVSAEHIVLHNTGGTRTCASCHESAEPRIVTAIANQDRTCSGCHADAGHNAGHASNFDGQGCADCHDTNVQIEHHRTTASSGAARCSNCHLTPSSVVVDALGGATWDKGCSQTGCHVVGTASEVHSAMSADHAVSVPAPACIASGCHSGTDLSAIHSDASTSTPTGTLTGCKVCHSPQTLPASGECVDCHPDRTVSHGFDLATHTSSDTCVSACHSSELLPAHDAQVTPTVTTACNDCHATAVPGLQPGGWNGECAACHTTTAPATHLTPGTNHVGSDALARDYTSNFPVRTSMSTRSYLFGCTPSMAAGQTICHDVGNLAKLHEGLPGKGCSVCHNPDRTTRPGANECLTCHGTGWYNPAVSKGTVARPGTDFSSSGSVTPIGGSAGNYGTLLTNDGATSYLRFASTNAEAMFGRGFWWLNPSTTSVTNVQVLFRAMKLAAGTTNSRMTVVLNVGGTTFVSPAAVTNPSATAYTQYTYTFATNPKTGLAWTPQDLNDPDSANGLRAFGVRQTAADTANIGVTEIYLKVNTPDSNYATPPNSGGQAHHYGNYLRSPETSTGVWSSAIYTQYCYDRCHAWPNSYNYYGDVLNDPYYSPFRAYQGTQMWSSLMGDPNGNSPTERNLTLEPIALPAGSPVLDFATNYSLGTGDFGYVEVSTDGGSSWSQLSGTQAGSPVSTFSGVAGAWQAASFDLSGYAGQTVQLRFRYTNTASATNAGWCIDNVSISNGGTVIFSDDAETLKPEWDPASHWRRIQYALRWLG